MSNDVSKPAKGMGLENRLEGRVWSRRCWYSGGAKKIQLSRIQNEDAVWSIKKGEWRLEDAAWDVGCRVEIDVHNRLWCEDRLRAMQNREQR